MPCLASDCVMSACLKDFSVTVVEKTHPVRSHSLKEPSSRPLETRQGVADWSGVLSSVLAPPTHPSLVGNQTKLSLTLLA